MFNQTDIEVANKTSRNMGAVGKNALVPAVVRHILTTRFERQCTMVLDFGAGKAAAHAQALLKEGWATTAYEFGDNVDVRFHNELALMQEYDLVYASNVLNVQSGQAMARETLRQVAGCLGKFGTFVANFPQSPRKSDMTAGDMEKLLKEQFKLVSRVGGSKSAPVWECIK